MTDDIFAPAFGNRPSFLVGREKILKQFSASLDSKPGTKERALILLGQRGSGKTILLWELVDLAKNKEYIVVSPTISSTGMLGRIYEKLQDASEKLISKGNTHIVGGSLGALGFSAGIQLESTDAAATSYQHRIFKLIKEINKKGKKVLILIDELQVNSEDILNLVILYQEMVGEGLDVSLVMAGLPAAVSTVLNNHVLTFLNRALKIELDPLSISEVHSYFKRSFSKLNIKLNQDKCREAAELTEGSPYMMQLVGHNIVLQADETGNLTDADYNDAINYSKKDYVQDICKTTLEPMSDKDREFLRAMADCEGECLVSAVAEKMKVTTDYAQKYRKRLLDAGIIRVAGRGKVEFAVPYIRDYLLEDI